MKDNWNNTTKWCEHINDWCEQCPFNCKEAEIEDVEVSQEI